MTERFALASAGDTFLRDADHRYRHVVDLPQNSRAVWNRLTADDALVSWSPVITAVRWTSTRPFGIGTTRVVTVGRFIRLEERFYRWQDGSRMTFAVKSASIPGLNRFAEDIQLEQISTGTRLTWTFALEGKAVLRPLLATASPVARSVTKAIAKGLADGAQWETREAGR
ncbi:SRPBCC family protein [Nocardia aurantiaca]|uniref:SRPBCC family protein n=1 Tax=Nocardia aurantiaca TaxID=2675850 RepID=A0A6I3L5W3_9NOCA|nr:SRPBCC family protein [Nocardia aurantiaca]MTE16738.1 SRPBCC family protein [Nocardia aurantiaca]